VAAKTGVSEDRFNDEALGYFAGERHLVVPRYDSNSLCPVDENIPDLEVLGLHGAPSVAATGTGLARECRVPRIGVVFLELAVIATTNRLRLRSPKASCHGVHHPEPECRTLLRFEYVVNLVPASGTTNLNSDYNSTPVPRMIDGVTEREGAVVEQDVTVPDDQGSQIRVDQQPWLLDSVCAFRLGPCSAYPHRAPGPTAFPGTRSAMCPTSQQSNSHVVGSLSCHSVVLS